MVDFLIAGHILSYSFLISTVIVYDACSACVSVCVVYVCVWKREGDQILVTCGICSKRQIICGKQ